MKKNYILISLATLVLSISGCNKVENELAPIEKQEGVNFELVTNVSTKTTITDYSTEWAAGDALNVIHAEAGSDTYIDDGSFSIADVDLANGRFKGTLASALEEKNYDWYVLYPYSSYVTSLKSKTGYITIGSTASGSQTQVGNNSTAHLSGSAFPLYGVASSVAHDETPSITMHPLTSVAKIVVTNNSSNKVTVNSVTLTAENETEGIVGTYYVVLDGENKPTYEKSNASYVSKKASLNTSVELDPAAKGTFYIGIRPFAAAAGDKLTLAVTTEEGTCSKTLTLASASEFKAGKVKTLEFSYTTPEAIIYNKVTDTSLTTGEYVIIACKTASSFGLVTYGTLSSSRIPYTQSYDSYSKLPVNITNPDANSVWTVTVDGSNVTIYNESQGKYMSNAIAWVDTYSESTCKFTYGYDAGSTVGDFSVSSGSTYLGVNKTSNYIKFYATGTLTATSGLTFYEKYDDTFKASAIADGSKTSITVDEGDAVTLTCSTKNGTPASYQWYSNTTDSNVDGTTITGAISSTYSVPTATAGTYYFYCKVVDTESNEATTNVVKVVVAPKASGSWAKISSLTNLSDGAIIVITTNDESKYLNGTVASGHFQTTSFDAKLRETDPGVIILEFVSESENTYKMKLRSTNKYITASKAASGGGVVDSDTDSYGWKFDVAEGCFDAIYQNESVKAYIRSYNNSTFRTYGSKNGASFTIYKYTAD